jgi:hypothetical protein
MISVLVVYLQTNWTEKIQALSLAEDCYMMKLDSLTHPTERRQNNFMTITDIKMSLKNDNRRPL